MEKRITKQVRISLKLHRSLKLRAFEKDKVLSKFLDEIILDYLEKTGQLTAMSN